MFSVMTYNVPAFPVMSVLSMVSLMLVVIDAVPMGIIVSMVGGGICCLWLLGKASHLCLCWPFPL